MKNLKKLVIASFMLVIAFVAVVSSTYAWFTQGTEAKVNDITVGVVDANKAMLVSKDGTNWSKSIDLNYTGQLTPSTVTAFDASTGTFTFKHLTIGEATPLSEINGLVEHDVATDGALVKPDAVAKPQGYDAYVAEGDTHTLAKPQGYDAYVEYLEDLAEYNEKALGGYIAFDLYFQVTVNKSTDWNTTTINMNLENLHAWQVVSNQPTDTDNPQAVSSFRLAVVQLGGASYTNNYSKFVEEQTSEGRYGSGDQFENTNNWMQIYRNEGLVNEPAENATVYTLKAPHDLSGSFYAANNTQAVSENYEYSFNCFDSNINSNASEIDGGLTRQFHIRVFVWMEGWDGDNVNAASGVQYKFDLNFKTE